MSRFILSKKNGKIENMIGDEIKKLLHDTLLALQQAGKIEHFEGPDVGIEHPGEQSFGDYATNIAFVIAKREKKNAADLATLIGKEIKSLATRDLAKPDKKVIERVEAVNGFVNFFISKDYLLRELAAIAKEKECYGSGDNRGKKIVVEYSSPNIAKRFGIGHLRSTIIGQAIYNLYKFLGWESVGINHLGDWGTPHGKIIYQLKEKKLKGKSEKEGQEILENVTVEELERLYVEFHEEAKNNPKMEEGARSWFGKLEQGDHEARQIWQYTRTVSLKEFQRVYDLLDVRIDSVWGESFYESMLQGIVEECKKKGIARESQGALIVEYKEETGLPPAMLLKSDGATTYFTRDLAAVKYRIKEYTPNILVYETGMEQTLHFKQVFAAASILGWIGDEKLTHVRHGFYRWEHGKFSTRSGETVHLEEILHEAISRARKIIEESETGRGLSENEKEEVARAVGIGGVKYNDLSRNPESDIIFDWDKVLNLKGNSAPYIQYTYARCASILKKEKAQRQDTTGYTKFSPEELTILRCLYRFPEVAREAAEQFSPNLICNFVFALAQAYNLFYGMYSVLDAGTREKKEFRLLLTAQVAQVIKNCLTLLGIKTPERL